MSLPSQPPHSSHTIRARAVVLGILLIPCIAWLNISVEEIRYAGQPSTVAPMPMVLAMLLVIMAINAGVGKIAPKQRLTPAELLTTYFMVFAASALTGHDQINVMVPILTYGTKYANPANGWATNLLPYIPHWMMVTDPKAIQAYYVGGQSLWNVQHLKIWVQPLLLWSSFYTILVFGLYCLSVLFRKQWTERERLSYPLVQFTLELVQPRQPLFRNKLFWVAFIIAAGHDTWFGLATLFPSVPMPYTRNLPLEQYITSPPWNAMGGVPLNFYPWLIGIGLLMPTDVIFSMWFFFWIWKLEPVVAAQYGWSQIPGFPYVQQQAMGAIFAVALYTIYSARKALWGAFSSIWRGSCGQDADEPISYRFAAIGFIASLALVIGLFRYAGMSFGAVFTLMAFYVLICIAFSRMRAELGLPETEQGMAQPHRLVPQLFGPNLMTKQDYGLLVFFHGFNRSFRTNAMPVCTESFRAAQRSGGAVKTMFWAMVIAAMWACLVGFFMNVSLHYHWGAASKVDSPYVAMIFGNEGFTIPSGFLGNSASSLPPGNVAKAVGVGFIISLLLSVIRLNFISFPLHPMAFAVSANHGGAMVWFTFLIAWIIKVSIMKTGGLKLFQKALPIFLGITLGECAMGTLWYLISALTGTKTFILWPY